ncbi:hypothetical protein FO519_007677 [Halicephalobus sp. NKZ332]|nr:hypothetical protein FO519_007677 [Halicephalobus sp. NKZ332]
MGIITFSLYFFILLVPCVAYKILIYQTLPSPSHVQFSGKLADVLVDAGHVVDKLIIEWNPYVKSNGTTKATRIKRFTLPKPSPWLTMSHMTNPFDNRSQSSSVDDFTILRRTREEFCDAMVLDKSVLEWIKEGKYDAAMSSAYDICGFGLFHLAEIKSTFTYSATAILDDWALILGLPNMASFIPSFLGSSKKTDRMTVLQKLNLLYHRSYQQLFIYPAIDELQTQVFRRYYGDNFPSLTELAKRVTAMFINSHPLLELQRPYSHKIKQIGGITLKKKSELSMEFEKILSSSKRGTVIFSFGSLFKTSSIPDSVKRMFVKAFSSFKDYNFIWKVDEEEDHELFKNSTNIYPIKWIQQMELLNDNRVKLFISHCGLNSLLEVTYSGVPVLSIPLFLDQHYNAHVLERKGTSIRLNKYELTVEILRDSIRQLLENSTYAENARVLQKMLQNFPTKPEDTLIKWVEFGTEFKELEKHFFMESANLNVFEYFCLDAISLVIVAIGIILISAYFIGRLVFNVITGKLKTKME